MEGGGVDVDVGGGGVPVAVVVNVWSEETPVLLLASVDLTR